MSLASLLLSILSLSSLFITLTNAACLDPFNALCIDVILHQPGVLLFNITCSPLNGYKSVTWCGFGFSDASIDQMFPADITVVQWNQTSAFLEDRDATQGYSTPPCYTKELQVSLLQSSQRLENGVLQAIWTRKVNEPLPHLAFVGNMTIIGAISFDTPLATEMCLDYMQGHTLVQPGLSFTFPSLNIDHADIH